MEIIEINKLEQVSEYISRNSIFFVDIDDTLIKYYHENDYNRVFTKSILDNSNIFRQCNKGYFSSYCNSTYLNIVKTYNDAVASNLTKYKLSQPNTAKLFRLWNKKCKNVIGLTARGIEIAKVTEKMLNNLSVNFKHNNNREYELISNITGRSGISSRKIIYCGGYPKEKVLCKIGVPSIHYFDMYHPIVFLDDSKSNLEAVGKYLSSIGFRNYLGLHYVGEKNVRTL